MKIVLAMMLCASISAHAANTSANHGHHGGGNQGAVGASSIGAAGSSGQSGMGGNYWAPDPNASLIDAYQPWRQVEMQRFQKP